MNKEKIKVLGEETLEQIQGGDQNSKNKPVRDWKTIVDYCSTCKAYRVMYVTSDGLVCQTCQKKK